MARKSLNSWSLQLPPPFLLPRFSLCPIICQRSIRSIQRPPPQNNKYNNGPGLPLLVASTQSSFERKKRTTPLRTGLLAIKKGMSASYDIESGERYPCTIVQLDRVQVTGIKSAEKHGYDAVQVGLGWKHPSNVTRPLLGHYAGQGVSPKRHLVEFRVQDSSGLLPVGQMLNPSWFLPGQYVDARALSKGKGFAGVMKRHGMKGQPASHGVSKTHRSIGSVGPSQGGGSRVYPGKRMAGRMGGDQVTVQNVKVVKVDDEAGIVVLHGCIPGPKGGLVKLSDAIFKPWPAIKPQESVKEESSGSVSNTKRPAAAAKA